MKINIKKNIAILMILVSTIGSHISCFYAILDKSSVIQLHKYTQFISLSILINIGYTYLDFTFNYLYDRRNLWFGTYSHKFMDFFSYRNMIKYNFFMDYEKEDKKITPKQATFHMIFGYFIMIYTFAAVYQLIWLWDNQAFGKLEINIFNALYFSTITSATIGYGDIVPCSVIARIIVCVEVFFSLFYVFTVFSILPEILKNMVKDQSSTEN